MDSIVLVQQEPEIMSTLIEVEVTANGNTRFNIGQVPQLQNNNSNTVIIKSISLVTSKVLSNGMTVAGSNAPVSELRKMALTIFSEGWERGNLIPLLFLNPISDSDATTATAIPFAAGKYRVSDWANVDWTKSYITLANGTQIVGAPYVVMLHVSFVRQSQSGDLLLKG